jgi:hypothetical protein
MGARAGRAVPGRDAGESSCPTLAPEAVGLNTTGAKPLTTASRPFQRSNQWTPILAQFRLNLSGRSMVTFQLESPYDGAPA